MVSRWRGRPGLSRPGAAGCWTCTSQSVSRPSLPASGTRPGLRLARLGARARGQRTADELLEGFALDQLEDEVRLPVVLAALVDLDDVGVAELGDGLGLQAEADAVLDAAGVGGADQLEGD